MYVNLPFKYVYQVAKIKPDMDVIMSEQGSYHIVLTRVGHTQQISWPQVYNCLAVHLLTWQVFDLL